MRHFPSHCLHLSAIMAPLQMRRMFISLPSFVPEEQRYIKISRDCETYNNTKQCVFNLTGLSAYTRSNRKFTYYLPFISFFLGGQC